MDAALIIARALHFTATMQAAGAIFFMAVCMEPAFRAHAIAAEAFRRRVAQLAGVSLGVALVSGAAWFVLFVGQMTRQFSDLPYGEIAWTALTQTRFGTMWIARLAVAALLVLCLIRGSRSAIAAVLAAVFVGALAWSGHAGAAIGISGEFNVLADALHLIAAAAWLGGLVVLAMLLHHARSGDAGWSAATAAATQRFSNMGVISVATLLATGAVNTFNTVGIGDALTDTAYGRLLLAKIALFLMMVCIAIFNRHILAPRLTEPGRMARLQRNSIVEIALGVLIIAIVGALGTMSPTLAMHSH